jgi:hypothetical protein
MKLNEFHVDLKYSQDKTEDQIINDFYRKFFPNMKEVKATSNFNLTAQKSGIDKIITLNNGKEIKIEEKKRRTDYGDILLEEWSNFEKKKKGWTGDPGKTSDYIIYVILPKIYIFPYDILQLAWRENYFTWLNKAKDNKDGFKYVEAPNPGYTTTNVAVPINILFEAIQNIMKQNINIIPEKLQSIKKERPLQQKTLKPVKTKKKKTLEEDLFFKRRYIQEELFYQNQEEKVA